jgi:hypothetical protein
MARGSCQTRIELKNARRAAAKLQKESRHRQQQTRPRSNSTLERDTKLAHQLELWLDGFTLSRGDEEEEDGYSRDANVVVVDIWTDIRPVRRMEYQPPREEDNDDDDEVESDEDERRSDSKKIDNSSSLRIRRTNNGMYVRKKGKGKAHPNANHKKRLDSIDVTDVFGRDNKTSSITREGLCANEFFFGSCAGAVTSQHRPPQKGRKGSRSDSIGGEDDQGGDGENGCSLVHFKQLPKIKNSTTPMTLSQALNEKLRPRFSCDDVVRGEGGVTKGRPTQSLPPVIRDLILKSSFQASMPDANCLDMMYHTRLTMDIKSSKTDEYASQGNDDKDNGDTLCNIDDDDDDDDDDEQDDHDAEDNHDDEINDPNAGISKLHDRLRHTLDEEGLSISSIVYLTIYGVLIYDRYRGGLVVTKDQEQFLLYGSPIVDITTPENVGSVRIHERLTHHILDEILSFSDVACTAILPQVCRYWRDEIGTRSPQLWNMLLDRYGWSVMSVSGNGNNGQSDDTNESQLQVLRSREAFVAHYTVVRDVKALTNAVKHISGGANVGGNDTKFQCESAIQNFKSTNGAPVFEGGGGGKCIVKIWSGDEDASPRSIAVYPQDCTLRLFEVVRGSNIDGPKNIPTYIKCRQLVCLRAAPLSVSRKKDTCQVVSMDLDDEIVACLVEERLERKQSADLINPWITVLSREDTVCAGNEGLLDAHCLQSHEMYSLIMDHLLTGSTDDDITLRDMQDALYENRNSEFEDLSNVLISVRPKLIACGRCHFIFSAFVHINESDDYSLCGHRLFLFSSRTGTIVKSRHIYLGRNQEGPYLFGSRPFKNSRENTAGLWSTNILVSGPAMAIHFLSVEIQRNGKAEIIEKSMIENDDLAPWSTMKASLTSSTAVFSTESRGFGANLHIQNLSASYEGAKGTTYSGHESIQIGGSQGTVKNLVLIREHYVAVVINRGGHDEFDHLGGHWFGPDEAILGVLIIHIPTRKEIYRCPFPLETISLDSLGDTLAMSVANLGFVITGGNARDIARMSAKEQSETPGKSSKGKKKRLVGQTKHKPKQTPHSYSHR